MTDKYIPIEDFADYRARLIQANQLQVEIPELRRAHKAVNESKQLLKNATTRILEIEARGVSV